MSKARYAVGIMLNEEQEKSANKLRERGIRNKDIFLAGLKSLDGVVCDSALDNAND